MKAKITACVVILIVGVLASIAEQNWYILASMCLFAFVVVGAYKINET